MINTKSKVYVITTGGTIEKSYDEHEGTLFNWQTIIHHKLNDRLRLPHTELCVKSLMAKDSLDMTKEDRFFICDAIHELLKEDRQPVVVLHGTDTMQITAELCAKELKDVDVPVIFTGAMRPLGFERTDAIQNVTEALMAARLVVPGVYISFHNRLFKVPGVRKNHKLSTFEQF